MNTFLWIELDKKVKERFLLKCFKMRVNIYETKEEKDSIWVRIEESDYAKIKKFWFIKIKATRLTGFKAVKKKIYFHRVFLVSILFGCVLLYLLSHIIVEVEVIHSNKDIRDKVTTALANHGIKKDTLKKSYQELEQIKEEILNQYPEDLEWMEIEVKGMKYIVRIEERKLESETEEKDACNLVATKDGIIKELVYSKGVSLVKMNDAVKEGDILISGTITKDEENKGYTCATGKVYAEVWYQVSVTVPREYKEITETGKVRWNLKLTNNQYDDYIFKSRLATYQEEKRHLFTLFGTSLSFIRQKETQEEIKKYTEEEAIALGLSKAEEKIQQTLEAEERVLDKKVLKKAVNDSTIELEVFVVALENIAQTKEFQVIEE